MRVKKGTSWAIGIVVLTGLYLATLFAAPQVLSDIGGTIVLALAFATIGYQGAQVADNWQRSKYYRDELMEGSGDEK